VARPLLLVLDPARLAAAEFESACEALCVRVEVSGQTHRR